MPARLPVWKLIDSLELAAALPCTSDSLTAREHSTHGYVSTRAIRDRFGGWSAANQICGHSHRPYGTSKQEAIDDINRVASELDCRGAPTHDQYHRHGKLSVDTIKYCFGRYNVALEEAGLSVNHREHIPKHKLIEDIRRVSSGLDLDRCPTREEYNQHGRFSTQPIRTQFGTYSNGVQAAGYDPTYWCDVSRDELVNDISRVASDLALDRPPTIGEYREHGKFSPDLIATQFGTYNGGVIEAGYAPNKRINIAHEELVSDIQRVASDLGLDRGPTTEEYAQHGRFAVNTIANQFGSWGNGLKETGYSPNRRTNIGRQELIDDMQSVSSTLSIDRGPTTSEYNEYGEFSAQPIKTQFGSYTNGLREAGLDPTVPASGRDNPRWSGRKPIYYNVKQLISGRGWDATASEARERANHVCQACGDAQPASDRALDVHHIIPLFRGGTNNQELLIALCRSCHRKTEVYTRQFTEPVLVDYTDDELPEGRLSSADAYEHFNGDDPPTPTTEQTTFSAFATASD